GRRVGSSHHSHDARRPGVLPELLRRLLAARDGASPGPGLGAAALDQLLEALEIAAHPPRVEPRRRAEGFCRAFRLIAHRQADECPVAARLERHGAAGLLAVLADPADLAVGMLLEDLRVPLGLPTRDQAFSRLVTIFFASRLSFGSVLSRVATATSPIFRAACRFATVPCPIAEISSLRNFRSFASALAKSFALVALAFTAAVLLRLNMWTPPLWVSFPLPANGPVQTPEIGRKARLPSRKPSGGRVLRGPCSGQRPDCGSQALLRAQACDFVSATLRSSPSCWISCSRPRTWSSTWWGTVRSRS